MSTRIRYTTLVDGIKQSMQVLKADNGQEYYVLIMADDKSAHIADAGTKTIIKTVYGTNPGATRMAAKKALKELGVVFETEIRPPRRKST